MPLLPVSLSRLQAVMRMEGKYRKSGIDTIDDIPWGTHMCQFYRTKDDLIDVLVPYFKAGLENNEFCMWVTSEPLGVKEAKASLCKAVRELDDYISKGQIEILDYSEWYTKSGKFNADEVLQGWLEKEGKALEKGFGGLRLTGNTFWLEAEDWVAFKEYEAILDSIIGEYRMIAMHTYSLDRCAASEVLDVLNNHEITLVKRKGRWRTVESDERKRLKKLLSGSEVRFRRLFETAKDGILILDANTGQIVEINPFLKDMLGYTTEELRGKRLWEIGLFKDIAKSEDAFKELQREGYIRYEDLQLETKDGKTIDVEFVSNVYDIDHKKIIQCNIRDISRRKEVEEAAEKYKHQLEKSIEQRTDALEESNRKLRQELTERKQAEERIKRAAEEWRTTFDSITDLVSIHDKDFRLVRVNKAFADVFKMKPGELIGKFCYQVVHGTNEPVPGCPHKATLETNEPATGGFFAPHLGIHLEVTTSPIFDEKGGVVASVHVSRDTTERRRMQEQLIVTDRLASVGEMASGIAHELNNPLTSVIGFSELLLEKDVPDDVKEDLRIINREAQRTAGVVRNLLTFARKHAPEKQLADINGGIKTVLALRAYEQKVSNIQVNTYLTPDLPEIMADSFQLQQVFLNIITNAEFFMVEAHGRGTLTITTERVGDIVRVALADDGPGIAEENLGHVFDPFFTTKEVGKGTGLGLSICHGIVTEHTGRIYAESELGKGATFVVELPISK